jgi:hypothetical protein
MKCSDRNQLENISNFIDFVALLIESHIWRNDIKHSPPQDAPIDIKITPFEWSPELHIKCAFSFHTMPEFNALSVRDNYQVGDLSIKSQDPLYTKHFRLPLFITYVMSRFF